MSSTFLVPVNGDWSDQEAVKLACDFAKISKGKVIVLYVIEMARNLPVDAEVNEATTIVVQEAAEREVDTIVLASQYKMKFGSFSLGKAVPYILKNAPCKIVLWRGAITQTDNGDKQDSEMTE